MSEHTARQLAAWARAVRASDHDAFSALYEALHGALLRYAWTLTHDEAAGYDILQDAFLSLWKTRHRIDPDRSIEALLYRIVRNLAYKHNRRRKKKLRLVAPLKNKAVAPKITDAMDADMLEGQVKRWVAAMPPRRREVFELSRNSHLTHQEIADLLDVSPKTVNNHLVAALRYLRDRMHAYNPDQSLP